jgi:hypothetical protein
MSKYKTFSKFLLEMNTSENDIEYLKSKDASFLDFIKGEFTVNEDGSINVKGNVVIKKNMAELTVDFNEIDGNFIAPHIGLKSMKRFPRIVTGDVIINSNDIKIIERLEKVGDDFNISNNELSIIKNFPLVGKDIILQDNYLETLDGIQDHVNGNLFVTYNHLTNFRGFPNKIDGDCFASNNRIQSEDGLPDFIGKQFYIYDQTDEKGKNIEIPVDVLNVIKKKYPNVKY